MNNRGRGAPKKPEGYIGIHTKSLTYREDKKKRGMFRILDLPQTIKKFVVYRKTESLNPDKSDTFHEPDYPWVEQFTGMPEVLRRLDIQPRIRVDSGDGGKEEGLKIDDGLIFTFHGTCIGERALAVAGDGRNTYVTRQKAEESMELDAEDPEMFNMWEFRVNECVDTDGPERREQLQATVEQQRQDQEGNLIKSVERAFQAMATKMSGKPLTPEDMVVSSNDLVQMLSDVSPDQMDTIMSQVELSRDNMESLTPSDLESDEKLHPVE